MGYIYLTQIVYDKEVILSMRKLPIIPKLIQSCN